MIKAPIRLQDLRRRIYVKAKADMFCVSDQETSGPRLEAVE
jgi:hypothetical protein